MKKVKLLTLMMLIFWSYGLSAQNITVTGTLTDAATSETMIGGNVQVKGTSNGTITDLNGQYSITVSPDAILVFSYLGYIPQEIKVNGQRVINVTMKPDSELLEEVVVVGASFKKSDLTGAVGSVNAKTLTERPVTNVTQALQGRVAGVLVQSGTRPGDDTSIRIRGINTINTGTDPIYVVDGLVMDNNYAGFNSLNINDVASIEVMKDASATALYGSRGSNGVVLITTKKGQRGEGKITYDGWVGFQEFANTPETLNGKQLYELRQTAYFNGYMIQNPNSNWNEFETDVLNGSNDVFVDFERESYKNGKNYNWLDQVTRTGIQQSHSVSFSNGTDKGSYYLSFGYFDLKGVVKNVSQTRYTGRINADHQIKSWLKVGTNTSFTRTEDAMVDDYVFSNARNGNPLQPIDSDLALLSYGSKVNEEFFNPINSLKVDNDRIRNRLLSSNFININPLKGLNIRSTFSLDYVEQATYKYTPKAIYESTRYGMGGEAKHNKDGRTNWQWDNTISYDTQINNHSITGLVGTSMSKTSRAYTYLDTRGFATDDFSYHNIGSGSDKEQLGMGSDFITETLAAYLLRVNYNYAQRYYLTATARYDGSSKFARGHQWGIFPSFSAAWNVTGESFMQDQKVFDILKLRVGYGIVGNQNIDNFAYRSLYYPSIKDNQVAYTSNGRRGTIDITWEKQKQLNVGVDMAFLNNRLRASIDAFYIKNDDLLMKRSLPTTSGYREAFENIGAIENKGIELSLNAAIIQTKDLQWNFSGNISADRNKVTKLFGESDVLYNVNSNQDVEKEGNLFIGKSRNTIYTYKSGGVAQLADMEWLSKINFNGRNVNPGDLYVIDADGSKTITEADKYVVGSTDPKFYGGFSTDLSYKGFEFNAVFNYSYGAKKLSSYYETLMSSVGTGIAGKDLLNAWTPENTNTNIPKVIGGYSYPRFGVGDSDYSVQNASFLRLSSLTLAYTLPKKVADKLFLDRVRIYATGSNLFCITNYGGYDPETGDWYPPTRMYTFGINLSF
ncbi:TonB-dependent receptor [Bacteroides sp. 519]|uniref:SusC/RagA family TonB-linked outer membrane protein n=1 Tax=Bacteroides sp. 519 TaxID=2302937 RepID=UPI0013D0E87C|nr:TonB-dependent receptor [Bacteroides sp. 519]NDV57422.1 TonB-dependent receptor [Bacteroides sp. 519]